MPNPSEPQITLEELLKLKRHEVPEQAFWDRFERDFENRRLRALMSDEAASGSAFGGPWWTRLGWASAALASAAALAFLLVHDLQRGSGFAVEETSNEVVVAPLGGDNLSASTASAAIPSPRVASVAVASFEDRRAVEPRFVLDALPAHIESHHFRRVLANPAFVGSPGQGAQFVADALTAGERPAASFLVDRSTSQF